MLTAEQVGTHPFIHREFESWLNKYNEEHCKNIKILTYAPDDNGIEIVVSEYDDVVEAEIEKLNDAYAAYKSAMDNLETDQKIFCLPLDFSN